MGKERKNERPGQNAKGASNGEVLLLHGGQDRGSRLQQCLECSLGDLFRPRLPRRWRLDVGSRCRPREHPRLQCSSHRDDEGQEDNASSRLGCQHLRHCRRHSSVRCWIFSPAMVGDHLVAMMTVLTAYYVVGLKNVYNDMSWSPVKESSTDT